MNLGSGGDNGKIALHISDPESESPSASGDDLSDAFETGGSLKIEAGSESISIQVQGIDVTEPYSWFPDNTDDVIAFVDTLANANAAQAATLTIRDFVPVAPSFLDDAGDAISGTVGTAITPVTVPEADGDPAPTYAASGLPGGLSFNTATRVLSGTPTAAGSGTITVTATNSAGMADWTAIYAFAAGTPTDQPVTVEGRHETRGEATVSEEAPPLVLADSDDTGLDVDCKALLVASEDATVGNFFYEDTDRGGTDEPLDGELGLGADESIISGVRRRTATVLQLNDDDNPTTFDIGAYFDTGGAGNDLTAYLQTTNDGEVSFPAAAAFARANQVRFTLPADAQTLLDNLEDGDRWIFKLARPTAVTPTDQTVTAEGRHETRGEATISEEVPPPFPATDQTVTAEGRHGTRGESTVSEEAPAAPATDQAITAEGRHGTRGEAAIVEEAPAVGPLRDLRVSVGGRDYSDHVERGDWRIIRRTGVRSEARFRIVALPGEIVIPMNGEVVLATATSGAGAVTLFGGYLDEPEIDAYIGVAGLYEINLQSIGFRARLDDTLLTQAQGINIVQMATAAEQIEALVALLSSEGFTSSVTLSAQDAPDPEDMRLQHIGPVVDRVSSLNNAIPVVSATKAVSVVARDLVTADLHLDETNTELLRVEDSRQNYRTSQVTRGGDLLRTEGFAGRSDGRYRLGGVDNLDPEQSLFDVSVGHGVLWTDERARGGRGNSVLVVLLDPADNDQLLPASVVAGSDRAIDSLLLTDEAGLVYDGPDIDASKLDDYALLIQAGDGSEYAFRLAEMAIENGPIQYSEPTISLPNIGSQVSLDLSELSLADSYTAGVYLQLSITISGTIATIRRTSNGSGGNGIFMTRNGYRAFTSSLTITRSMPVYQLTRLDMGLTELDAQNLIAKLRTGTSKLVLVDTTQPRIDFANRTLRATDTIIEIEATGIHTLDVDGAEVDLGGEDTAWHWAQALQEVQESPPSDPPPTTVTIRYRGRWVCRESDGTVPRVERVVVRKDLALPEDGRRFGREQLAAHGRVKETLLADLITGFGAVVPEGTGVSISQALIDRIPQVTGLTPTDVLRIERVEMFAPEQGDLIQQTLRLLRRADESRYRDDWRRTLLERVGSD